MIGLWIALWSVSGLLESAKVSFPFINVHICESLFFTNIHIDCTAPTLYHLNFNSTTDAGAQAQGPRLIASKLSLRPLQLSSHPTVQPSPSAPPTMSLLHAHPHLHPEVHPITSSGPPSRSSTPQPSALPQTAQPTTSASTSLTQSLTVNVPNAFKGLKKKLESVTSSKSTSEQVVAKNGDVEVLMETDLGIVDFGLGSENGIGDENDEGRYDVDLEELKGMQVVGNAWTGEVWCLLWEEEFVKVCSVESLA